jgi:hypothetical protein
MGKVLEFPKVSVTDGEIGESKEGKLIEFPKRLEEPESTPLEDGLSKFFGFKFVEKPAAKSSTSVLQASVCQKCGCKLDGKIESMRPGCTCPCHKGRIR